MAIILLLLLSYLTPFQAAAQVADVLCDNVRAVAATLPNKTSSSPVHFATATFGQAPDIVYALALCRGDIIDDTICANFIANKFQKMFNATPPPGAQCYQIASYYAEYILVYSTDNILAAPSNTVGEYGDAVPPFERWNVKNVTDDVPLVTGLIHDLLEETVEKAASASPRLFATGVVDSGTIFPKVYSLAQCTPDLSAGDCLACLRRLLGMVNSTMATRMGGQMGVIRCYFRYDASKFYNGEPMLILGPPSPAPTLTEHKRRMSKLWAIPIVLDVRNLSYRYLNMGLPPWLPHGPDTCVNFLDRQATNTWDEATLKPSRRIRTNGGGSFSPTSALTSQSLSCFVLQFSYQSHVSVSDSEY